MDNKKKLTPEQLADAARLKALYESKKKPLRVTQYTIADDLGISQGAVGHYLNGRLALNVPIASAFARVLNSSVSEFSPTLAHEIAEYASVNEAYVQPDIRLIQGYEYPLFSPIQAGKFQDTEPFTREDAERWISTAKKASYNAFWLTVAGHSMMAPQGVKPSIPEGVLILVDPNEDVMPGDFCVATMHDDTEATFKRYVWEDGQAWLEPLNPNPRYQPILFDENCRVLGKVVHAKWPDELFN